MDISTIITPEIMQIIGMIAAVIGIFFAIKIAKTILKIIFSLITLAGIAMTLYGDQISIWFSEFIASKM